MKSLYITQHIIEMLKTNEELVRRLTDNNTEFRIYPIDAKISVKQPFVIINRNNINANYCKDGRYSDIVTISIITVTNTYAESVKIADLIRDTIDGKSVKTDDYEIKKITLNSANENIVDDCFIQELIFDVIY